MSEDRWSVIFYVDDQGHSPVEDFLDHLDQKSRVRFDWSIEQLRIRNVAARDPLVRQVGGRIWELRRESNTNIFRLCYFFFSGRRIVFLHGFQKKTPKTPRQEIAVAEEAVARELRRGERGEPAGDRPAARAAAPRRPASALRSAPRRRNTRRACSVQRCGRRRDPESKRARRT